MNKVRQCNLQPALQLLFLLHGTQWVWNWMVLQSKLFVLPSLMYVQSFAVYLKSCSYLIVWVMYKVSQRSVCTRQDVYASTKVMYGCTKWCTKWGTVLHRKLFMPLLRWCMFVQSEVVYCAEKSCFNLPVWCMYIPHCTKWGTAVYVLSKLFMPPSVMYKVMYNVRLFMPPLRCPLWHPSDTMQC